MMAGEIVVKEEFLAGLRKVLAVLPVSAASREIERILDQHTGDDGRTGEASFGGATDDSPDEQCLLEWYRQASLRHKVLILDLAKRSAELMENPSPLLDV